MRGTQAFSHRYGIAVASTALALLVTWLLRPLPTPLPSLPFLVEQHRKRHLEFSLEFSDVLPRTLLIGEIDGQHRQSHLLVGLIRGDDEGHLTGCPA